MAGRPQDTCRRGLHSFSDPKNVGFKKNGQGVPKRFCLPCKSARDRLRYGPAQLPELARRPTQLQLEVMQARADGLTDIEIAEVRRVSPDGARQAIRRTCLTLGIAPSAAGGVAVCLAYELIKPDTKAPRVPKSKSTAPYVRSMLALVQGRREPYKPRDVQRLRMLDALYAWSEPHAVSVLWAAGLIVPHDVIPLFAKEK